MANDVVAARLMGFCAGPQDHEFFACEEHRALLDKGEVTCFMRLKGHEVREVSSDEAEDQICHFCREG